MLKGISISLLTLSTIVGFQANASIEETLGSIDFKGICKEEGGQEIAASIAHEADTLLQETETKINRLKNRLEKDAKNNKAAQEFAKKLSADYKKLVSIAEAIPDHWSQQCFMSKKK
jgi:hypothetical protein